MTKVIISGFKNDVGAKEFISWYSESGEHNSVEWLECRKEDTEAIKKSENWYTNTEKTLANGQPHQDDQGNWVLVLGK